MSNLFMHLANCAFEKTFFALAPATEKAYRSRVRYMREVIALLKQKTAVRADEKH